MAWGANPSFLHVMYVEGQEGDLELDQCRSSRRQKTPHFHVANAAETPSMPERSVSESGPLAMS